MIAAIRVLFPALALVAGIPAVAGQSPDLETLNGYRDKTVWITIYDLGKTRHLDYGCVLADGSRRWHSGGYVFGSFYYIRGEVKDGDNCSGRTICDTTVQANPQLNVTGGLTRLSDYKPRNTQWIIEAQQDPHKCYWKGGNFEPSPGHPLQLSACPSDAKLKGSYIASCKNCQSRPPNPLGGDPFGAFDWLTADCKDSTGFYLKSSITGVSRCVPNTIRNENGKLACDR